MGGETRFLEVVVPAHNEAERLPKGLAQLSGKLRELPVDSSIIVVDNASDDATPDIVREWSGPVPVQLVQCAERGKGAAVRAGLLATRAPYAGFCDADMATDLAALDDVIGLLASGHRVIVGSRGHEASQVEARHDSCRHVGAILFNRLARQVVGDVSDTQCGFKFFDGRLVRAAAGRLLTTGFAFDVELLMHCRRFGADIKEIPVSWDDVPGSTFSMRRHAMNCMKELAGIWKMSRSRPEPATFAVPAGPAVRAGASAPDPAPGAAGN